MNSSNHSNFSGELELSNGSENFGLAKLQQCLGALSGQTEPAIIDWWTAYLIEQLTNNLELVIKLGQWNIEAKSNLHPVACFPNLPANFPDSATMPMYLYGDKVFARSLEEYGLVIGRFYAFNSNQLQWKWQYLILVDYFNFTYVCWETDLQPLD